jgi:hypothetical protein
MNELARAALSPPANGFIGPRLVAWCSSVGAHDAASVSTTWGSLDALPQVLGESACVAVAEVHAALLQVHTATCSALHFDLPTVTVHDDDNAFVRVLQHAHDVPGSTALVELLAGTVCVARTASGDSMHIALPSLSSTSGAIYRCAPTLRLTRSPFLSLDELVYVAAVSHAVDAGIVAAGVGQQWLSPVVLREPARFARVLDDEDDDGLLAGALPHPDALLDRARWVLEVLGTLPMLTTSWFKLPHDPEVLARRTAAAKRWVPSALYWLWHTFLLGEDEAALFLDVARAHRARVVRDAARVVEQLQRGHDVHGLPAAWTARVAQYANDARARACNGPATP